MKKILVSLLAVIMAVGCIACFAACTNNETKYVAKAVASAENEQYGFCVGKSATNGAAILAAMNKVIAATDIDAAVEYYTAVSKDETPANQITFANLSDNTAGTLEVYTCSGFEPYEFVSDGTTVIGVDIYLMELVAEELNMKINVHDVDFDGIVGTIATQDNAIGAAGITITDARKESVNFSEPYFSSVQYIISTEEQGFTKLSELAGKKIGVQKGTTGCTMVTEAIENGELKDTGATVVEYDTGAVAFTAMKQGKCDFVVIDELPAKKLVG